MKPAFRCAVICDVRVVNKCFGLNFSNFKYDISKRFEVNKMLSDNVRTLYFDMV